MPGDGRSSVDLDAPDDAFFGETLDGAAGPTLDEITGRYPAAAVGAP